MARSQGLAGMAVLAKEKPRRSPAVFKTGRRAIGHGE